MASCVLWWFVLCWSVADILAQGSPFMQGSPCLSITTQYAWNNLGNISLSMSNVQQLQDLALQPILHERVPGTLGNRQAREHIKMFMTTAGWTVEEDSFNDHTPYGSKPFSNIIATLDPRKSQRLVFACHYDSKLIHGVRFVGAIDSAVPCAILMDIALRMSPFFEGSKESTSNLTLQFVFFDGEEALYHWTDQDSLYGSRHLANKWAHMPDPKTPGHSYLSTIEAFVLLDLIGTPDTIFKKKFTETSPVYDKLQNIELCLQELGYFNPTQLQRNLFSIVTDTSIIQDDHIPFLRQGVPVVHLITWPYPRVWHTQYDDFPALEMNLIDNLARILRVYLADLPL